MVRIARQVQPSESSLTRLTESSSELDRQTWRGWVIPLAMDTPVRILVADDSDTMRHAICALLQAEAGVTVCGEAGNYAELLKIFNATTTDVVLMDLRMPGEKLFTAATIKDHLHGSCLLAMSVWNDEETAKTLQPLDNPFGPRV